MPAYMQHEQLATNVYIKFLTKTKKEDMIHISCNDKYMRMPPTSNFDERLNQNNLTSLVIEAGGYLLTTCGLYGVWHVIGNAYM